MKRTWDICGLIVMTGTWDNCGLSGDSYRLSAREPWIAVDCHYYSGRASYIRLSKASALVLRHRRAPVEYRTTNVPSTIFH